MSAAYQEERKPDTITFLKLAKKHEEPLQRPDDMNSLDFPPADVITVSNYENSIYSSDDDSKYFTEDPRSRAYSQGRTPTAINLPPTSNNPQYSKGGIIINSQKANAGAMAQPAGAHRFPFTSGNGIQINTTSRNSNSYMVSSPNNTKSMQQNMLLTSLMTSPTADKFGSSSAYTNSQKAGETYKPNSRSNSKRTTMTELLSLPLNSESAPKQKADDKFKELPVSPTDERSTQNSKIPVRSPKRPLLMHTAASSQADLKTKSEFSLDPANYKDNNDNTLDPLPNNAGSTTRASNVRASLISNGTDSFSVTSFDHLTQRNTDLNSRRIIPSDHFDTVEENEDEENKRVSLQLKPPAGNLIREDLDLTDDEQLTNLITSMKLEKLNNNSGRSLKVIDHTFNEFGPNSFIKKNFLATESSLPMANSSDFDFDIEKELRLAKQKKLESSFSDIPTRTTSNGIIQSSMLPRDNDSPVSSSASMSIDKTKVKNIIIAGPDYNINDETLTALDTISKITKDQNTAESIPNDAVAVTNSMSNSTKTRVASKTFADTSSAYRHQRYKSDAMELETDFPRDIDPSKKSTGKNIPAITHRELPTPPIEYQEKLKSPIEELTEVVDKELKKPGRSFSKTSTIDRLMMDQASTIEELHLDKKKEKIERRKSGSKSRNPSGIDYKQLSQLLRDSNVNSEDKEISQFLPEDEKILLNKTIDALSKLTAEMIADPNRYKEGMKRMKKALNILEGFE